jgi:hypothetical protein
MIGAVTFKDLSVIAMSQSAELNPKRSGHIGCPAADNRQYQP